MIINIASIKPDQHSEISGSLSDQWVREAVQDLPVRLNSYNVSIGLEKKGEFIEVEGRFSGNGTMECVKCLQAFEHNIDQRFRLFLYMEDDKLAGDGGETELNTEELDFAIISGEEINIAEILREQMILSLPDYPQCNATCQGLCVKCGVNLNKSICNCPVKAENSPFFVLKDLKIKN